MLTQVTLTPMIQVQDPVTKTVNIVMSTSIQDTGVEIARTTNAMTFQAGDIAGVQAFVGLSTSNEITYLQAFWA